MQPPVTEYTWIKVIVNDALVCEVAEGAPHIIRLVRRVYGEKRVVVVNTLAASASSTAALDDPRSCYDN